MPTKTIDTMTVAELEAENQRLMLARQEIIAQQRVLGEMLDKRRAEQDLAEDIEKLKAKHGVQTISAQGIASAEAVGDAG
jgi:hypothetical protein